MKSEESREPRLISTVVDRHMCVSFSPSLFLPKLKAYMTPRQEKVILSRAKETNAEDIIITIITVDG